MSTGEPPIGSQRRERAQSNPLGLALVIGMVLVGSAAIVTFGASAVSDTQRTLDVDRAEKSLTQMDSRIAMVALGDSRSLDIGIAREGGSTYQVHDDAGWMNVTITDTETDATQTMFNETLGSVVFENDGRKIAYQGGGVWKGGENSSLMVSPPEFYYRDATLTLPLVTVSGDSSLSSQVQITQDGPTEQYYPDVDKNPEWENPLDNGRVNVSVQSEHYRAWGSYWESRTDGNVEYDHARNTATLTLVVPAGRQEVRSAVAATAEGGDLKLSGSGSAPARTDSYNSSEDDYGSTVSDEGTISTAGEVEVSGNSEVRGTVRAGGRITLKGGGEIYRDAFHSDGIQVKGSSNVYGSISQISGVDSRPPIDSYVERRYGNLTTTNDNGDTSEISGDSLASGDQTLGPGRYHLNRLSLDDDTLTLDTGSSGEEIIIGVRDYAYMVDGGRIEVDGNGKVRLLVNGASSSPGGYDFEMDNTNSAAAVDVLDQQNATQMWLYGREDFSASVVGDSSGPQLFEGVVYAPGGTTGTSSFAMGHADVYGGVVVGAVEINNGGSIHYDQALRNVRAVPPDESIIRLTYLHISRTNVDVSS